ncbi:hypothetical protein P3342_012340 [Pyrenophora teres f. teres]|nr:hypothetical protein P3342_012340 [Pyrenophora teres f. teres]
MTTASNFGHVLQRLLCAERMCTGRIGVLQKELAALQSRLESIQPSTRSVIRQVARSETMELTEQVMNKLPREIRDMIYFHLSTRHDEYVEREHYRTTQDPLTKLYSYDFERWKAEHFPEYYWKRENVAEDFHQEMAENYYRTSTFVFADGPAVMKRFLTTDEMKLGVIPKDLVSNAEIKLFAVVHNGSTWRTYMKYEPKTWDQMRDELDGMLNLRHGANVVVRLVTEAGTEEERIEQRETVMAIMSDEKQMEKWKAYKVRLLLE